MALFVDKIGSREAESTGSPLSFASGVTFNASPDKVTSPLLIVGVVLVAIFALKIGGKK